MKINYLLINLILNLIAIPLLAQVNYHSVDDLPLYGKVSEQTQTRFERLPSSLYGKVRSPVWDLGKNTAGLYLRFRSNSTKISLKWSLLLNRMMNHMAATGIKGFDLYCLKNNKWEFVNVAKPGLNGKDNETTIVANMDNTEKEFLLYFPLYDGITDLQIGIDPDAQLDPPGIDQPVSTRPVICYGTSILQGGCATRPGMVFTNILTRSFNREFINLGFSANAQLDYEIAEIIGGKPSALIILDFMANVNAQLIEEKLEKFCNIIRQGAPNTPILLIEMTIFPQTEFDLDFRKVVLESNQALKKIYKNIRLKGDRKIYLVPASGMIGKDNEGTVDGVHFTDLGFMRYAEFLAPHIKKHIEK